MTDTTAASQAPRPLPRFDVDAVAFDLDGTLLDTIHDLARAVNRVLVDERLAPLPLDTIRDLVGKGMGVLLGRALAIARGRPAADAEIAALLPRYQAHYAEILGEHTLAFPGLAQTLRRLRDGGFALAVVTNKATKFVRPHLARAGVLDCFDAIVGGDDAAAKKPDPAPLRLAARKLGVPVQRMLMVGDSANDAQAARAAGCPVLLVPFGYSEGVPVQAIDCDGIVDRLSDVVLCLAPRRSPATTAPPAP